MYVHVNSSAGFKFFAMTITRSHIYQPRVAAQATQRIMTTKTSRPGIFSFRQATTLDFLREGKNMATYNNDARTVLDDRINFWHKREAKNFGQ